MSYFLKLIFWTALCCLSFFQACVLFCKQTQLSWRGKGVRSGVGRGSRGEAFDAMRELRGNSQVGVKTHTYKMEHEGVARDKMRAERHPDYPGPWRLLQGLRTLCEFEAGKNDEICEIKGSLLYKPTEVAAVYRGLVMEYIHRWQTLKEKKKAGTYQEFHLKWREFFSVLLDSSMQPAFPPWLASVALKRVLVFAFGSAAIRRWHRHNLICVFPAQQQNGAVISYKR